MTQFLVFHLPHWLLPFHSLDESIISPLLFMLECPPAYFSKFFPVTDLVPSDLMALNNPTWWSPQHFFLSHRSVSLAPGTLIISCLVNIFYRPSTWSQMEHFQLTIDSPSPKPLFLSYTCQKSKIWVLILCFPPYAIFHLSARPGWFILKYIWF